MKIKQLVVGSYSTNCYVVINEVNNECFVLDPGASADKIYNLLKSNNLTCKAILVTHGHDDHIGAAEELQKLCDGEPKIYIQEKEKITLEDAEINVSTMVSGVPLTFKADVFLKDEEEFEVAGFKIKCLSTPGHTPGGCCYYLESEKLIFTGDTLFFESVGRTDKKASSAADLIRGIREKLFILPEDTNVLCGHGFSTTIGHEMENNPYVY